MRAIGHNKTFNANKNGDQRMNEGRRSVSPKSAIQIMQSLQGRLPTRWQVQLIESSAAAG